MYMSDKKMKAFYNYNTPTIQFYSIPLHALFDIETYKHVKCNVCHINVHQTSKSKLV